MSSRSLNKVMLIGNLTRDPEMRYTPNGAGVCSFGLATNRSWASGEGGERREETEFHRIVAWNKLAELCAQLLTKGRKVYIEGRLQTRNWEGPEGEKRNATEVVAEDMVLLDSRREVMSGSVESQETNNKNDAETKSVEDAGEIIDDKSSSGSGKSSKKKNLSEENQDDNKSKKDKEKEDSDEINIDDIPF